MRFDCVLGDKLLCLFSELALHIVINNSIDQAVVFKYIFFVVFFFESKKLSC